jgi:ABC-2 type transport system permease protein
MRAFFAFFKKELTESLRTGRLVILGCLFVAFGIMNPAIAKLTPWLMEMLSESLAESGMTITAVPVDALTSWTQFYKNIPMALIAFVLIHASTLTREYESGTLILLITKGLSRQTVVLAKSTALLSLWTAGYWLCFGVTYLYNDYFWDNSVASALLPAAALWWLFGAWTVCLLILFSTLTKSTAGVLLGTGGCVLASYLLSAIPRLADHIPTALASGMPLLVGAKEPADYTLALILTLVLSVGSPVASLLIIRRRNI